MRSFACRSNVRGVATLIASAVATLGWVSGAQAQFHGIQIGKSCQGPKCVGETTDCSVFLGHADGFGDTIELLEAWDTIDPSGTNVRVPAVGDLPIVSIQGNAFCSNSGGTCDQSLGVNCALPCRMGPANSTLSGLPGAPQPGFIVFRQNQYVILPTDPSPLLNRANIRFRDLCDSPTTSGCSMLAVVSQFTAATTVTHCIDQECATTMCTNGVCSYAPDCVTAADCTDDMNVCTTETCTPVPGGPGACCESIPECTQDSGCPDDGNPCTDEYCTPEGCCDFIPDCTTDPDCDDENACTTNVCTNFCCIDTPVGCDDHSLCTTDTCDPDEGCVFTPITCNDNSACTTDTCDPLLGCVYTPIVCDDMSECTTDTCNPSSGCVFSPIVCNDQSACTSDTCDPEEGCRFSPINCNDSSACTTDTCNPATGCVNTPITCDDGSVCTADTCNPSSGCVYTPIEPAPVGCTNIPTVSEWGLVILAMLLAIGGKIYFGRREGSLA